jgi:endonuclease/exonuclease/phosphatase family metal-dependent hydrolase
MSNATRFPLFHKLILLLNGVAVFILLLSCLAAYLSPAHFWIISFLGLGYPVILVVIILFLLYWMIFRKGKIVLFNLILIVLGWLPFTHFFAFNFSSKKNFISKDTIRVMTYNVRNFDLYNWSHNNETRQKMFDLIKLENPDVVCFQEFYTSDNPKYRNISLIKKETGLKNYYFGNTFTLRKTDKWGIALFTRFPIIDSGNIIFKNSRLNDCIYADININNHIVRIYTVHLQSIEFADSDYTTFEHVTSDSGIHLYSVEGILSKMKKAFIKRGKQVDALRDSIARCPYPMIFCGDFNDSPTGYAYHRLSRNLKDAFLETNAGIGGTYIGPFPSFRIDYILHSNELGANSCHVIHEKLSDHYPVVADLYLK